MATFEASLGSTHEALQLATQSSDADATSLAASSDTGSRAAQHTSHASRHRAHDRSRARERSHGRDRDRGRDRARDRDRSHARGRERSRAREERRSTSRGPSRASKHRARRERYDDDGSEHSGDEAEEAATFPLGKRGYGVAGGVLAGVDENDDGGATVVARHKDGGTSAFKRARMAGALAVTPAPRRLGDDATHRVSAQDNVNGSDDDGGGMDASRVTTPPLPSALTHASAFASATPVTAGLSLRRSAADLRLLASAAPTAEPSGSSGAARVRVGASVTSGLLAPQAAPPPTTVPLRAADRHAVRLLQRLLAYPESELPESAVDNEVLAHMLATLHAEWVAPKPRGMSMLTFAGQRFGLANIVTDDDLPLYDDVASAAWAQCRRLVRLKVQFTLRGMLESGDSVLMQDPAAVATGGARGRGARGGRAGSGGGGNSAGGGGALSHGVEAPFGAHTFKRQFEQIQEAIFAMRRVLETALALHAATDPSQSMFAPPQDVFAFVPLERTALSDQGKFLRFLLTHIAARRLRRKGEDCYTQIMSPPRAVGGRPPARYPTHAWRKLCSIEELVSQLTPKETSAAMWDHNVQKNNNASAVKWLTKQRELEFPDLRVDRHWFAFNNGVFDAGEARFYEFGVQAVPPNVVAAAYHDQDFPTELLGTPNWYDIPTPTVQGVLEYQLSPTHNPDISSTGEMHDVCAVWYRMVGRGTHALNEKEHWEASIMTVGRAGTGKSTLVKAATMLYNQEDVGTIADDVQAGFGLETHAKKLQIRCYEMSSRFGVHHSQLNCMISGEETSIMRKHKTEETIIWDAPFFVAGNEFFGYQDKGGALLRRFLVLYFRRKVHSDAADTGLMSRIRAELPALLLKCARAYKEALVQYGTRTLWGKYTTVDAVSGAVVERSILPAYFHKQSNRLREATHPLASFLANDTRITILPSRFVEFVDLGMPLDRFRELAQNFITTHNMRNIRWSDEGNWAPTLEDMGIVQEVVTADRPRMYRGTPVAAGAVWLRFVTEVDEITHRGLEAPQRRLNADHLHPHELAALREQEAAAREPRTAVAALPSTAAAANATGTNVPTAENMPTRSGVDVLPDVEAFAPVNNFADALYPQADFPTAESVLEHARVLRAEHQEAVDAFEAQRAAIATIDPVRAAKSAAARARRLRRTAAARAAADAAAAAGTAVPAADAARGDAMDTDTDSDTDSDSNSDSDGATDTDASDSDSESERARGGQEVAL